MDVAYTIFSLVFFFGSTLAGLSTGVYLGTSRWFPREKKERPRFKSPKPLEIGLACLIGLAIAGAVNGDAKYAVGLGITVAFFPLFALIGVAVGWYEVYRRK